jgi:hypothetical protein
MPLRLATCKGCALPIVWITMRETGKLMPCDPEMIVERLDVTAGKAASNVTLVTEAGVLEIGRRVEEPYPAGMILRAVAGHVPHFCLVPERSGKKRLSNADA